MNAATVRAAIRDRILALTPDATYVDASYALTGVAWVESTTPLIPEVAPDTILPLAFWVDDREFGYTQTRSGHDPVFVSVNLTIRFAYLMREAGPPTDDWDRSSYAAEALIDHLLDPSWPETATDFTLQLDAATTHRRRVVGDGTVILWEIPFLIQYQRS